MSLNMLRRPALLAGPGWQEPSILTASPEFTCSGWHSGNTHLAPRLPSFTGGNGSQVRRHPRQMGVGTQPALSMRSHEFTGRNTTEAVVQQRTFLNVLLPKTTCTQLVCTQIIKTEPRGKTQSLGGTSA